MLNLNEIDKHIINICKDNQVPYNINTLKDLYKKYNKDINIVNHIYWKPIIFNMLFSTYMKIREFQDISNNKDLFELFRSTFNKTECSSNDNPINRSIETLYLFIKVSDVTNIIITNSNNTNYELK